MYVCMCVSILMAIPARRCKLASECLGLCKAHAHGDCCEAMNVCGSMCLGLYKAHAHCDCCEVMHACVGVCVWDCTRRMLTVIGARRCMRVLEYVFGLA
jgi:hypothetical protein